MTPIFSQPPQSLLYYQFLSLSESTYPVPSYKFLVSTDGDCKPLVFGTVRLHRYIVIDELEPSLASHKHYKKYQTTQILQRKFFLLSRHR